ncbi:MAG: tetratricopeptide repeat protein, partial [Myxococcales bacterium]|nr:tetratricopeptide repeat protein [Myxococcales bacterium]
IAALRGRELPNQADAGRLAVLDARRLDAAGDLTGALAAYAAAQERLGSGDIGPTIAEADVLARLAKQADAAKQADQARAYRDQRLALLKALESAAERDTTTALTLGRAYLASGDGAAAERWLTAVLAAQPSDVETHLQLADALEAQGKHDAAIDILMKAFDLDPSRVDVGVELARTLESAGRNQDAARQYGKLLAAPDATLAMRIRAGLFYARTGDAEAAAAQGALIVKAEPRNPAGLFLQAEGKFAQGKLEEARKLYSDAAEIDPQAMYLQGLGLAAERLAITSGETRYDDEALRAYSQAAAADPTSLTAQVGRARLHLKRREYARAIEAYEEARKLGGNDPDVAFGLGVAYQEMGQPAKAIEWLERSVREQPRAEAHYRLAELSKDSSPRAALSHYAAASRLAKKDEAEGRGTAAWLTDALWQLGELEYNDNHDRGMCDAWRDYLGRNPSDAVKVDRVKRTMLARCR